MSTHFLEGRKREERLGELRNVARHKRALTNWRGGRGRSGLVSFESWHVTNEHSPTGGEEEGGAASGTSNRGNPQSRPPHLEGRKREERLEGSSNFDLFQSDITTCEKGNGG